MPLLPNKTSYSETGGEKQDFAPVVDTSTDRSADEVNTVFGNVAMTTRTVDRFWCRVVTDGSGDGSIDSSSDWDAVWKGNTVTAPVIAHPSAGTWTITLPTTVLDVRGDSHSVNLTIAFGNAEGSTFSNVQCEVTSANVITVRAFNASGTLTNITSGAFTVSAK